MLDHLAHARDIAHGKYIKLSTKHVVGGLLNSIFVSVVTGYYPVGIQQSQSLVAVYE